MAVRWVQIAPVGVTNREVRFQESSGAVIGLFQFPVPPGSYRGIESEDDFTRQPVLVQRIEPNATDMILIPVNQWTGDDSIDRCDWLAVCQATRRRLKLFSLLLPQGQTVLTAYSLDGRDAHDDGPTERAAVNKKGRLRRERPTASRPRSQSAR